MSKHPHTLQNPHTHTHTLQNPHTTKQVKTTKIQDTHTK